MIKTILAIFFSITFSFIANSAPWINANDISLRADIQLLSSAGLIKTPITTYPLMWASIAPSINEIQLDNLTPSQKEALFNIQLSMKRATKQDSQTRIKLYTATNSRQFTSFANNNYEKSKFSLSHEIMSNNWAGKLQLNVRNDFKEVPGDKNTNIDGSYIAYKMGNWIINYGMIDQWWGPSLDTSLIMSNNARPLPALSVRRNSSQAFESKWLSWIGPWNFTMQMAQLENEREIPDTKMWSSRATFKPLQKLEVGLSWSYMWGGKGQPNSYSTFFRGLLGQTECAGGVSICDPSQESKLGNQLAGYDIRWSDTFLNQPYSIYAQSIGEDSSGRFKISDKSYLYGLETHFSFLEQRVLANLEFSDTQANCGASGDTSQDCFYEHTVYFSGYRYFERSIGSTYDNDAETLTLTLYGQQKNGNAWQIKMRDISLNTNNRDRFPNNPHLGNSVSKIAQTLQQIDANYEFDFLSGRFKLGIIINDASTDLLFKNSFESYLNYQYQLN